MCVSDVCTQDQQPAVSTLTNRRIRRGIVHDSLEAAPHTTSCHTSTSPRKAPVGAQVRHPARSLNRRGHLQLHLRHLLRQRRLPLYTHTHTPVSHGIIRTPALAALYAQVGADEGPAWRRRRSPPTSWYPSTPPPPLGVSTCRDCRSISRLLTVGHACLLQ